MNDKHTPGPWRVGLNEHGGAHIVSDAGVDSQLIGETVGGGYCGLQLNDHGKAISLANARLIAAAPEMAEALKDLLALVDRHRGYALSSFEYEETKAARAALSKAGV
jgi:hypothetical protein